MESGNEAYLIRPVRAQDAGIVAEHRTLMFQEMGLVPPEDFERMRQASENWVSGLLASALYEGCLAEFDGTVVAGGGILLREMGPVPGCYRASRWGHIVNVYTAPGHRRRGMARKLLKRLLDWCDSNQVAHVTLSASAAGRPLYESLGFTRTWDMKLTQRRPERRLLV